jgi:predicted ATPase
MLSLVLSTLVHGTTVGLAFGYGAQPTVVGGLLVNLASSSLWTLGEQWRDRFGRVFNAELHINDDLLAALSRGLRRALLLGQKQYAEEWNTIRHQGVANAIKELDVLLKKAGNRDDAALAEIKGTLNKHTLDSLVHPEGNEPEQVLQSILPVLDVISDPSQRSATEAWLRRVILQWATLLFFEELKKNDSAGTAAWRAYTDLIFTRFGAKLDTLISNVDALEEAQKALAEAAKNFGDLKTSQEELRQELAPLLAHAISDAVMCSSAKDDILALFDLTADEFNEVKKKQDLLLAQSEASAGSIAEIHADVKCLLGRVAYSYTEEVGRPLGVKSDTHNVSEQASKESSIKSYLQDLAKELGYILLPLEISGTSRVPLDSLFLELPLIIKSSGLESFSADDRSGRHEDRESRRVAENEAKSRPWRIQDRMGRGVPLLITGGPGTGKTTLFKYIVCAAVEARRSRDRNTPAPWPVVLECRLMRKLEDRVTLKELLIEQFDQLPPLKMDSGEFAAMAWEDLMNGEATLFIDGIDELVSFQCRQQLCSIASRLAAKAGCDVIATSRPEGVAGCREALSIFEHLEISPLNDAHKNRYIDKWCALHPIRDVESLKLRLTKDHALNRLCESAHFLALVIQVFAVDHKLPSQELHLFRRLTEVMIDSQLRRGGDHPPLEANEVNPHMEVLAFYMHQQKRPQVLDIDATACFEGLRKRECQEESLKRRSSKQLLDDILSSLGVLVQVGKIRDQRGMERWSIQFLHQSWQTFFAAMAVVHGRAGVGDSAAERIRALLTDSYDTSAAGGARTPEIATARAEDPWHDVVLLATDAIADELGPEQAEQAVRILLGEDSVNLVSLQRRSILAMKCLGSERVVANNTARMVIRAALKAFSQALPGEEIKANVRSLAESRWRQVVRSTLINEYSRGAGHLRKGLGVLFLETFATNDSAYPASVVSFARRRLRETRERGVPSHRLLYSLLHLVEVCFLKSTGKANTDLHLDAELRELLFDCLGKGEVCVNATALWSLVWLLNVRQNEESDASWLSDDERSRIIAMIRQPKFEDDMILEFSAELLTSRAGVKRYKEAQL